MLPLTQWLVAPYSDDAVEILQYNSSGNCGYFISNPTRYYYWSTPVLRNTTGYHASNKAATVCACMLQML
jgi:hypothetical protein